MTHLGTELGAFCLGPPVRIEGAPTGLNIYLNGGVVQRDPNRADGWCWVDEGTMNAVELHGPQCDELKKGRLSNLVVEFGCPTIVIQ